MVVRAFLLLFLATLAFGYSQQNGDKQLNNLVSLALTRLYNTNYVRNLNNYYNHVNPGYFGPYPDECVRPVPSSYVGTLSDIINRGSIRFCLSEADLGEISKGAPYGIAATDIAVLGAKNGSLYGPQIDLGKLIANEVSFYLALTLNASFTLCQSHVDGWFSTIYNCLAEDECDVSLPVVRKLPTWEKSVDFTCGLYDTSSFQVSGKGVTPNLYQNFTGFICSVLGTAQFIVAETVYPNAQYVFQDSIPEMWDSFCSGKCQYVVDDAYSTASSKSSCYSSLKNSLIPQYSPNEEISAITYRSSDVTSYSPASVLTVCFSFAAWIMAIAHLF